MDNPDLDIDFGSIETNDSISQEEKEAKILKILLTFENGLRQFLKTKDSKKSTSGPEAQLLLLMSLPTWNPTPLTQNALCRCIRLLYGIANFNAMQSFVNKMMDWMQAKEAITQQKKTSILLCIGAVFEVQGTKLFSFVSDVILLCLKILKTSTETSSTRYNAITLIIIVLKNSNFSLEEITVKEIFKISKGFLSNKSASFKIVGAECLESTILYCPNIPTLYLTEELLFLSKFFEDANFSVRRSLSSLISTLIAGSQSSNHNIKLAKPKKMLVGQSQTKQLVLDKDVPSGGTPTFKQVFSCLSALYTKSSTLEEIRAGVFSCYIALFIKLGTSFVENNYSEIVRHVVYDLNPGPNYTPDSPFDALVVRQRSNTLLREIGQKILSEQGQVHAAKSIIDLIHEWGKNSLDKDKASTLAGKSSISTIIDELSCLIQDLGDAAYAIQDLVVDPLLLLLETQSYSIQVSVSWCLRNLCVSLPSFLPKLVSKFINYLYCNFLDTMPIKKSVIRKALGYSYALGALISVSASAPQSVIYKLSSQIFATASHLLKSEANLSFTSANVNISQSQNAKIQVGWNLLGSLMCLGSNYVRLILPQITMLFKAYLAKSSVKLSFFDNPSQMLTLSVVHSKEHALQALHLFLAYNGSDLVEGDVSLRILPLLNNSLIFCKDTANFINDLNDKDKESALTNIRKLIESVSIIRKRAIQCFALIQPPSVYESNFASLMKISIELLTVTSKTDKNTNAWTDEDVVADWTGWAGSGYAMTSSFHRRNIAIDRWRADRDAYQDESNNLFETLAHVDQFDIDYQLLFPRFGAREYDPISLYLSHSYISKRPNYFHSMTSTVISTHDAAIDLFSLTFPYLLPRAQLSAVERMARAAKDKSDNWNQYIVSHCLFAFLGSLKAVFQPGSNLPGKATSITSEKVIAQIEDIIHLGLEFNDDHIRKLAAETLGYLCKHSTPSLSSKHIKLLVDKIVNYSDPDIRAGCLLGLSSIYQFVGSAISSSHLASVVQVMRTLCNDMHPLVHTHALNALAVTINSTGHAFTPYIVDTLYIVFRLFLAESHQPGGTAYSKNGRIDHFLIRQACGRVLHGIISVLGPEIATSKASKFLCYGIMEQLRYDVEDTVVIEYLQCVHLVIMFDYTHIDLEFLVTFLCSRIQSVDPQLRRIAANCLYQLVQKNVQDVLKYAGPNLFEQLFQLLDSETELGEIVVVLNMLLTHSLADDLPKWIDVIRAILTKHNVDNAGSFAQSNADNLDQDDDSNLSGSNRRQENSKSPSKASQHQGNSRWRTQLVALQILRKVILRVQQSTDSKAVHPYLVSKFGDLVKLAFAASTTPIENISLEGYGILHDLLEQFKDTTDPQLPDTLLLDQYQAQIAAALAPALNGEFSPKVTASAIDVCATFLTIKTSNLKTMTRITKLMETALANCLYREEKNELEAGDFNFNAFSSITVNLAVLKGWATIALLSTSQDSDLNTIITTNLTKLLQLWIKALNDYAFIRLDPKLLSMTDHTVSQTDIRLASGLDFVRNASARNWVKPIYQEYWLSFLNVITKYLNSDEQTVLQQFVASYPEPNSHPSKNFWVLFGLCMETLASHQLISNYQSVAVAKSCLYAVRALFRPEITGSAFLNKQVFDEVISIFERFKYTYNLDVVVELVITINTIVQNYGATYLYLPRAATTAEDSKDSKDGPTVQLVHTRAYRLLKFYIGVLLGFLPNAALTSQPVERPTTSTDKDLRAISTTTEALHHLVIIAPTVYCSDLSIILLNLLQHIIFAPHLQSAAQKSIDIIKELVTKVESKELVANFAKAFLAKFSKLKSDKDNKANIDSRTLIVASNCLIAYTSVALAYPLTDMSTTSDYLDYSISTAITSLNIWLFDGAIESLTLLVRHFEATDETEATHLNTTCKILIQRLLPTAVVNLDRLLELNPDHRVIITDKLGHLFRQLYQVGSLERKLIARLFVIALVRTTVYSTCIPTVCSHLTTFATLNPDHFKATVLALDQQDRTKLETALRNNTNPQPHTQPSSATKEIGNEKETFHEEDEFDEFDDYDDYDEFDEEDLEDTQVNKPTIQLKTSFF